MHGPNTVKRKSMLQRVYSLKFDIGKQKREGNVSYVHLQGPVQLQCAKDLSKKQAGFEMGNRTRERVEGIINVLCLQIA